MKLRKRRILMFGAIAVLVCGVAWHRGKARPVLATPGPTPSGTLAESLDFGGRMRTDWIHVPVSYTHLDVYKRQPP